MPLLPLLSSLLLAPALAATPQGGGALLVQADRIVVAPDLVLENGAILVRDGVVAFVGSEIPADAKRGATVLKVDGTVVPGFVNPHSHLGLGADLAERISALTPELKAADAFDPFDEMLIVNARGGVTTVGLAPLSSNTFAGVAAAVKAGEVGEVIRDASYMKIALVDESLDQQRFPTSRMGAAELIRASFDAARLATSGSDPKAAALRDVLAGSTPLAIHARSHGSITAALDLCEELGVTPLLIGADEVEDSLPRLAAMGGSVILASLSPTDQPRALELPGRLAAAGVPFSFMADAAPAEPESSAQRAPEGSGRGNRGPRTRTSSRSESSAPQLAHPDSLRRSAALAVRNGLPRAEALAALTRNPAVQCGVDSSCGSLRQGRAADFLVFSGDPLDLTSRLTAVYIAGRPLELHSAEDK